ncbi:MAG: sigma-70 factor domain-containing protein [Actinomycetota bacterium]
MTRDRRFKQAVRKLMRATGQNYLSARAFLQPRDSADGGEEVSRVASSTQEVSGAARHEVILRGEHDLVMAYLDEIGKLPVLTDDEELRLAQEKEAGELAEWYREPRDNATGADRATRAETAKKGRAARKRLTEGNLELVVSIARRYQGQGLGVLALIEAGNHGLVRAVDKFDGTPGRKSWLGDDVASADNAQTTFAAFATPWIVAAIHRALDVANHPRVPRYGEPQNNRHAQLLQDLLTELPAKLGRAPTVEEVAKEVGFTAERARRHASSMVAMTDLDPNETDRERAERVIAASRDRDSRS